MNEKKLCSAIRDLLPLYMDNLVSEETKDIVNKHLEECKKCSSFYNLMNEESINNDKEIIENIEFANEVDYLKKIRKKSTKKVWLGIGIGIFIIAIILFVKIFIYGTPTENYGESISIVDNQVKIKGEFFDSYSVYSHYKIVEKDGQKKVIVYAALSSFLNKKEGFEIKCSLDEAKEYGLISNNQKILHSGKVISNKAVQIYAKKNPYIGDMSKNNELANAIGISKDLGQYTNELQTEAGPFGWTLYFQTVLEDSNEKIFNEKMKSYAYILLATIDNVDEITWSYMVKNNKGIEQKVGTLSTLEADGILGEDIKNFGESEERVDELLVKVGISQDGKGKSQLKEYKYRLTLTGRLPNAIEDSTYVVLTNNKNLTFEDVTKSLFSSNSNDTIEDMVIVSME